MPITLAGTFPQAFDINTKLYITAVYGSQGQTARQAPSAWWLALFPGLAIFITVTIFNLLGEALSESV
ncbi:MAG: hypothetical protein Kow0027_29730 [Saprospiraceae bacterium]|nr:hypothetical protein [Saprospirales bacterium]